MQFKYLKTKTTTMKKNIIASTVITGGLILCWHIHDCLIAK